MAFTIAQPLLGPVVVLNLWTLVMEVWMYALRIPAISKYGVKIDPVATKEELNAKIPRRLQFPADNYNHLMEQPTQFYAVTLALAMLGDDSSLTFGLAWGYVGLRVVHSLVQATTNPILLRLQIFVSSSLVLLGLTARAAMMIF